MEKLSAGLGISVVIPVAVGDSEWQGLLTLLDQSSDVSEILLTGCEEASACEHELYQAAAKERPYLRLILGQAGRAPQLNRAIAEAKGPWIWALHADSRFSKGLWPPFLESLQAYPQRLHYFDLAFQSSDKRLLLNSLGARWRAQLFGMPFGDQGFAFLKSSWEHLGGFPENLPYGEDHIFVWRWRQAGGILQRIPYPLATSPRKYEAKGWLRTTCKHVVLTWKQAAPELLCLWQQKYRKFF